MPMKVVILCGGEGTRMREHTENMPKPLVEIGGRPILWHLMKIYSSYGFRDFVVCLGYKGEMIKKYFVERNWRISDFTINTKSSRMDFHTKSEEEDWNITFIDTGTGTTKSERVKMAEPYIDGDEFFVAYGDDVSNVNIKKLLEFHRKSGKIATLTSVNQMSQFGIININEKGEITGFQEKPLLGQWINGGFFVFNRKIFSYMKNGRELEKEVFGELTKERQINAFRHTGFWASMNTFKDVIELNKMWDSGKPPWKVW